jgi:hypothetical protein
MPNYIEFRVYLKDDADVQEIGVAASELQDELIDLLDPATGAPPIFTQDVTYEVIYDHGIIVGGKILKKE